MKVPEKIFFCCFGPFWVKNTLHMVTNGVFGGFRPISANMLMLYAHVLLYDHYLLFFGPSALAERPMDSRLSVRPSVRASVTAYLENRASDFDDFFTDVRYYCS